MSDEQKASNRKKSSVRVRVEHVFAAQAHMGGHIVRTMGKLRAQINVGMMNLVYTRVRLCQLEKKRYGKVAPAAS